MTEFNRFFEPASVAFLGASSDPRKWGFRTLFNIITGGFAGKLYPVNPRGGRINDLDVYRNVAEIPEAPDLAVIVVPPGGILQAVRECGQKGIRAVIVITAGFAEVSGDGTALQKELVELAHSFGMRLIGPNCFGLMSTPVKLYAQMPNAFPPPGPIAVVSQSGNVGFTIAQNAMNMDFGCSRVISTGNEADLHAEDFIEYLAGDDQTRVIMSYIEGFKDGRRFFEIASRASLQKPIVMIKVGETEAGASAARSHTASLSGTDAVFDGISRQAGIIRVYNLQQLMNVGYGFLCHPLPRGNRVGIVTLGGGWGVLAADACAKLGLDVVRLPDEMVKEMDSFLPGWWSRNNPVDLVAGAPPGSFERVIEILAKYDRIDAVIALGLPGPDSIWADPCSTGENREEKLKTAIIDLADAFRKARGNAEKYGKPVIFSAGFPSSGGDTGFEHRARRALSRQNMVCYSLPDEAALVLSSMVRYSRYLQSRSQR